MSIRPRFKNACFADYEIVCEQQRYNVDYLKTYADNFSRRKNAGVILLGNKGTGKTYLAHCVANEVFKTGKSIYITKCIDMLDRLKATWADRPLETELDALKDYRTCDLLIIDDLAVQFGTTTEQLLLYKVIDYRYEYLRPTLITVNGSKRTVENMMGERCFDRLQDNNGKILLFEWGSYRVKAKEEEA